MLKFKKSTDEMLTVQHVVFHIATCNTLSFGSGIFYGRVPFRQKGKLQDGLGLIKSHIFLHESGGKRRPLVLPTYLSVPFGRTPATWSPEPESIRLVLEGGSSSCETGRKGRTSSRGANRSAGFPRSSARIRNEGLYGTYTSDWTHGSEQNVNDLTYDKLLSIQLN